MVNRSSVSTHTLVLALLAVASGGCTREPFVPTASACEELFDEKFAQSAGDSADSRPAAPGYGGYSSSNPTDRDQRTAHKLTTKGVDKYNEGDFRGAIRALGDAHQRQPSKEITLYAARSFRELQCGSEARELYRRTLATFSGDMRADESAEAQAFVHPPPPPPSKEELDKARRAAAERAAREDAELAEAKRLQQEERDKHSRACDAVRSHTEHADLAALREKAQACPEAVTDTQKGWLAEYQKSLEMTASYEKALSGRSSDMERFYYGYYETGDPRVEEIRKLAEKKFGPANPSKYKSMRKRLEATSTPSFTVSLCDISGDTAKVLLTITNYTAAVGLGSLLTGSGGDFLIRAARAQKISQDSTISNAKRITGAKNVELYSACSDPHWYLSDRPWPPKKEQKK